MSEVVGVVGPAGSGKSTSIHGNEKLGILGLNPKETVIINIAGKPLPFKGWKKFYQPFTQKGGNYYVSDKSPQIVAALDYINTKRKEVTNIVIDDFQYIMAFEFVQKALIKDYQKFSEIAKNAFDVIDKARNLRDDVKVFFLTHSEEQQKDMATVYKIKTIGRLLDEKITLEGLFTVLLFAKIDISEDDQVLYRFVTNRDGEYPAKSPVDMFDNLYIPNDLGYVAQKIDEYYN